MIKLNEVLSDIGALVAFISIMFVPKEQIVQQLTFAIFFSLQSIKFSIDDYKESNNDNKQSSNNG